MIDPASWEPVRRPDDGELCGHVAFDDGAWHALAVFGEELGRHESRDDAVDHVLADGLASLAERWVLHRGDDEQIVCILEANDRTVTVALDYYAMPGVPTLTLTVDDLLAGRCRLRRT
jgi:hypothetical protein